MNRSSVADIYKFIVADLSTAATYMNNLKFSQILPANKGRATSWAAKALLGKVASKQKGRSNSSITGCSYQ